jgi:hypothetical protein
MEEVWVAPIPAVAATGSRKAPGLDVNRIRVASEFGPSSSPAPPGNAIVPAGWILQMGADGETDVSIGDTRGGPLTYDATMAQPTVPINSGGWPPLPPGIPQRP